MNSAHEQGAANGRSFRRVLLVAFVAGVVGLIYVAPHIAFRFELGDDYRYPFLGMVDERSYGARIQEAYQGNYSIGNPYLLEHKKAPYAQPPLPEIILALLYRTSGVTVGEGMVLSDFFFPALTFVLIHFFLRALTNSFGISLIGAAFVMLSSTVIMGIPHIVLELLGKIGVAPVELIPNSTYLISRAVNNQLTVVPFLLTMMSIYALYRGGGYAFVILGGICQGMHYYIAPFYWGYVLVGSGVLCAYLLFVAKDRRGMWMIIALNGIGLLLSVFYWIHTLKLMTSPIFQESAVPLLHSVRAPFLSKREILTVLCFLILYRRKDARYFFFASFMLGSLICENQQLITGRTFANFHFIYTSGLILIISMVVLFENLTSEVTGYRFLRFIRKGKTGTVTAMSVALFLLLNAFYVQSIYYLADRRKPIGLLEAPRSRWMQYQSLHEPFQWLRQHADKKKDVVVSSEEVSSLLPIFTELNVLANRFADLYIVPQDELIDRWLIRFRIYGISSEELDSFVEKDVLPYYTPYIAHIVDWFCLVDGERKQEAKKRLSGRYLELTEVRLPELLRAYHVRYVFLSPFEEEAFGRGKGIVDLSKYPFLTKVYDRNGIKLYEFGRQ